jgi:hypothetical protein
MFLPSGGDDQAFLFLDGELVLDDDGVKAPLAHPLRLRSR